MPEVSMKQLLEAGVHFGHQTSRWNPKMKPYIFGARNGIYIIDLQQTVKLFAGRLRVRPRPRGQRRLRSCSSAPRSRRRTRSAKRPSAAAMFYVNNRWLGGTLTNFQTIKQSIDRLKKLRGDARRSGDDRGAHQEGDAGHIARARQAAAPRSAASRRCASCPTRSSSSIRRRKRSRSGKPTSWASRWSPWSTPTAIRTSIDYKIPGNDDAIRAIRLFCAAIADAVLEGRALARGAPEGARATRTTLAGAGGEARKRLRSSREIWHESR